MSDAELLAHYGRTGSADAFARLVERHVDLVYSVARRTAGAAAAEDVAQLVFIELARRAGRIDAGTPLVAWLHVVTRRKALNALREAQRRTARERNAAELAAGATTDWSAIEPLLDAAVEALPPLDRTAVLLRFFQDKSLREVGTALGVSDDAAQKRVSRALETLRASLLRRGVATTAAMIAADLSVHAVQAAPPALGPAICAAAAAGGTAGIGLSAARVVLMSTLQKTAAVAAFAAALGAGLYQTAVAIGHAEAIVGLEADHARVAADLRTWRARAAADEKRLAAVEREIDARMAAAHPAASPADAALEAKMAEWQGQLDALKALLARRPELNTPQLQLLSEEQWFRVAAAKKYDSETELLQATAELRGIANNYAAGRIASALKAYVQTHDGMLPESVSALGEYLDRRTDPAILDQFKMLHTGRAADYERDPRGSHVIGLKAPADPENDTYWWISSGGGFGGGQAVPFGIQYAQQQFMEQNGRRARDAADLVPFLPFPIAPALLQRTLDSWSRRSAP